MSTYSVISLGEKSKTLLYPLLASLFHYVGTIGTKIWERNNFSKHQFFKTWIIYISETLLIVL